MTMQRPNADLKSLYPLHVWKDVYGLLLSLDKFSPNDFRAPHGYFVLNFINSDYFRRYVSKAIHWYAFLKKECLYINSMFTNVMLH